ncbi:MAG TPA: hypothetical protein VMY37_04375 [Thermoguttaceae bacterium]|nr:hypothetical protein [Thermoguttaceae bacterium]
MNRKVCALVAAALLLVVPSHAQTLSRVGPFAFAAVPTPTGAEVIGPTEVEPGMPAVFTLKGVPAEHLATFEWGFYHKPADAMVLDLADRSGNLVLIIWAKSATAYAVIADVNIPGAYQLIVHEVVVGTPTPPDPPVPPPVDRKYQVAFFLKALDLENLPQGQQTILGSLTLREELKKRGHVLLGVYDKDCTGPGGLPEKLKPWWKSIEGDALPRVALAPIDGGEIRDYPLPADPTALWKLLEAPR